jgi:NAD(P)-dependent dehydrogenase (short-subunit alcohol dehydrogenase family)
MVKQGRGGSIALCSSAVVRVGFPNHEAISFAKGAVEGLVRSVASTYAPHNIRINAVAPGSSLCVVYQTFWNQKAQFNKKSTRTQA